MYHYNIMFSFICNNKSSNNRFIISKNIFLDDDNYLKCVDDV